MPQLATITSKRQLTIPVAIFNQARFRIGQKVLISLKEKSFEVKPATNSVEELAGSVKVPIKFKGLSLKQIIRQAKKEYFNHP